jgi:hypothetical protein
MDWGEILQKGGLGSAGLVGFVYLFRRITNHDKQMATITAKLDLLLDHFDITHRKEDE